MSRLSWFEHSDTCVLKELCLLFDEDAFAALLPREVCMALHGSIPLTLSSDGQCVLLLISDPLYRPRGGIRRQTTICREEEMEEDRYSGEYYSGEEFYDEGSTLPGDRYYRCTVDQCS